MGKIVKYCSKCDESFAEKFTFCPNCAEQLTAFEMKPVDKTAEPTPEPEKPAILDQDDPVLEVPEVVVAETERVPEPEPVNEPEPEVVMSEPVRAEEEVVVPEPEPAPSVSCLPAGPASAQRRASR